MSSADGLSVVRTFSSPPEAHLARSVLDAAGIPTYLADDNIVAADWLYSNAVGGVKLLVPSDRRDEAIVLLDAPAESLDTAVLPDDGNGEVCAGCGGTRFEPVTQGRRWAALSWLLVGVPLAPVHHRRRCVRCGAVLESPVSAAGGSSQGKP
jgi:hypothetical protein